jgi:hypothetical protein
MAVLNLQDFMREMEALTSTETDPRHTTEFGAPFWCR